eukprot:TRINITY_DN10533_c0_g1_i3.p1 TRINITY_DN10533_c0_g1~~TRINITY_DN10533_c0_g1_i3.p1  ORF type:complete len:368 (+),score=55.52 TRINITY_DN10533_c0_g1_i3:223-1326(+)
MLQYLLRSGGHMCQGNVLEKQHALKLVVGCWSKLRGFQFQSQGNCSIHTSAVAQKDYYDILGVPRNATENEIKKAFYQQAKKYHPDSNKGDPSAQEKFQEVQKAYEVLKDKEKRQAYDQIGSAESYENMEKGAGPGPGAGGFQGSPFGQGGFDPRQFGQRGQSPFGGFEDIFEEFFRGSGRHPFGGFRQQVGVQVVIDFMDAIKGGTKKIQLGMPNLGLPQQTLDIKIPPGATDGTRMELDLPSLSQQGIDLYVQISVNKHPYFERHGDDILVKVKLSFVDLLLGKTIRVDTVLGKRVEVKVPQGTQHGARLRVSGHGAPVLGAPNKHGDMYIEVEVELPQRLTRKQKQLLEDFRAESDNGNQYSYG